MPRISLRLLPVLLLSAVACTPLYWVRADTEPQQLEQDMALCRQQAWREASWRSWLYRPFGPTVIQDLHGRRVLVWPYSPFGDPFGDRFFEESRLTDFCMRAKGYELVPADKIQPSPEGTSAGKP
jgi:hypothetical protein